MQFAHFPIKLHESCNHKSVNYLQLTLLALAIKRSIGGPEAAYLVFSSSPSISLFFIQLRHFNS